MNSELIILLDNVQDIKEESPIKNTCTHYISIYSINISVQILYNDVEKCITNKKKTRNDDDGKHGTEIFSPFVRLMYFDDEIIILIIINEKEKENFESIDFLHFSSTKNI